MICIEKLQEDLRKELRTLDIFSELRQSLVHDIEWRYMDYHTADDEHENPYYTIPDKDSYSYEDYLLAQDILNHFDKFIDKGGRK